MAKALTSQERKSWICPTPISVQRSLAHKIPNIKRGKVAKTGTNINENLTIENIVGCNRKIYI